MPLGLTAYAATRRIWARWKGQLNIAAGQSTSLYILPEYLQRFNDLYPGIRINLHSVTGQSGMKMLLEDQVDLAIGPLLQIPDSIIYRPFASFGSILITPENHPLTELEEELTLEDISPYGLILPPRNMSTWRMVDTVFRQRSAIYGGNGSGWLGNRQALCRIRLRRVDCDRSLFNR